MIAHNYVKYTILPATGSSGGGGGGGAVRRNSRSVPGGGGWPCSTDVAAMLLNSYVLWGAGSGPSVVARSRKYRCIIFIISELQL